MDTTIIKQRLKENWKSGFTVALISLPLSIALSIASGAGPVPGIITGFWAPLFAAFFGSSNSNIVGVAGALSSILFAATIADLGGQGGPWILPFLAMGAGVIILAIRALKLDRYLRYVPSSVMYGFALGVALQIAFNQLFDAVGLSMLKKHGHVFADAKELVANGSSISFVAVLVFVVFLAFILIWKKKVKTLPAIIPAAALGTLLGMAFKFIPSMHGHITLLVDKYGNAAGQIPVSLLSFPKFGGITAFLDNGGISWFIETAIVIALVAVLETLITMRLGDKAMKEDSNANKELLGLGLANLASGFFGGLPSTGVFIRTGANIKAGATHKTSQGITAVVTGILAFIFLPFFKYIPLPVVAAMLFNTAIGLIETEHFKRFWKEERESFFIAILVAGITVFVDAGFAVMIGVFGALLFFVERITRGKFELLFNVEKKMVGSVSGKGEFALPKEKPIEDVVYGISGFLGYIDAPQHVEHIKGLADVASVKVIVIRMRNLYHIDLDGVDALAEAIIYAQAEGKQVLISSVEEDVKERLMHNRVFQQLEQTGKFFEKTRFALASIGFTGVV